MAFTPEQRTAYTEYFRIFDSIARRLILEGKAHVENGKLILHEDDTTGHRKPSDDTTKVSSAYFEK